MKIVQFALRSFNDCVSRRFHQPHLRTLSTNRTSGGGMDDEKKSNSFESSDDFERRIFSETSGGSFFTKLDRLGKVRDGHGSDLGGGIGSGSGSRILDGLDESFNILSDGMDGKLEKAATYFEFDEEEVDKDDYSFRPDMTFKPGMTYETKCSCSVYKDRIYGVQVQCKWRPKRVRGEDRRSRNTKERPFSLPRIYLAKERRIRWRSQP